MAKITEPYFPQPGTYMCSSMLVARLQRHELTLSFICSELKHEHFKIIFEVGAISFVSGPIYVSKDR